MPFTIHSSREIQCNYPELVSCYRPRKVSLSFTRNYRDSLRIIRPWTGIGEPTGMPSANNNGGCKVNIAEMQNKTRTSLCWRFYFSLFLPPYYACEPFSWIQAMVTGLKTSQCHNGQPTREGPIPGNIRRQSWAFDHTGIGFLPDCRHHLRLCQSRVCGLL